MTTKWLLPVLLAVGVCADTPSWSNSDTSGDQQKQGAEHIAQAENPNAFASRSFGRYDRRYYPVPQQFASYYYNRLGHPPHYGPGYQKDKYGHGYGYSCRQGDDCDKKTQPGGTQTLAPQPSQGHPYHQRPFMNFGHYNDRYGNMPAHRGYRR